MEDDSMDDDSADSMVADALISGDEHPVARGRRRQRNPGHWKSSQAKKARIAGTPATTYKTKKNPNQVPIPARFQVKQFDCRCKCASKLSDAEKDKIFKRYGEFSTYSEQTLFLQSRIRLRQVARHRKRIINGGKEREKTFEYCFEFKRHGQQIEMTVCKKAFCLLLGIKESRLRRKVQDNRSDHQDRRGSHNNRPNRTPSEALDKVRSFITNLPARESHYSRKRQETKKYLDATVTIKALYDEFLVKNLDCADAITYHRFNDIFNTEFNISIGYPRSDLCQTCEKLNAQIAVARAKADKQEEKKLQDLHELHKRRGEAFHSKMIETKKSLSNDPTQAAICFDYEKNLPLPVTSAGPEYYKRQLWIHNFCVHNLESGDATMFMYSEHYAGKGPNEVISMLDWYFSNKLSPEVKTLYIFADNCAAQNKNRFLFAYFQSIVDSGRFRMISVSYPIPGHSFLPCDRDFAKIEKKRKRCDRVEVPSFWVDLVRSAQPMKPFDVVFVEHPLTNDLLPDDTPVVKVHNFKAALERVIVKTIKGQSRMKGLLLSADGAKGRITMTGDATIRITVRKKGISATALQTAIKNADNAFHSFLDIKQAKANDVRFLLQYIALAENVTFYDSIRGDGDESRDGADDSEDDDENDMEF